jgi:hypothetical protein
MSSLKSLESARRPRSLWICGQRKRVAHKPHRPNNSKRSRQLMCYKTRTSSCATDSTASGPARRAVRPCSRGPARGSPADAPETSPGLVARRLRIRMLGVLAQLAGPTAIIEPAPMARPEPLANPSRAPGAGLAPPGADRKKNRPHLGANPSTGPHVADHEHSIPGEP